MSLLDEIIQMTGSGTGSEHASLAGSVMEMLQSGQGGGLSGLVETFQKKGLGDIVSSWVSTGQNLPVSASQIQSVLGSEYVQQLATKVGISPDSARSALAGLLPVIVDKLTPNGKVPAESSSSLLDAAMSLLKGKQG